MKQKNSPTNKKENQRQNRKVMQIKLENTILI